MTRNFRCILLLAVLAWLLFGSFSPVLASFSTQTLLPLEALDECLDNSSIRTVLASDQLRPWSDDCSFMGFGSSADIRELQLPDLRTLHPSDLKIVALPDGSRELRLSNTVWNSGTGLLELKAVNNPATQTSSVEQYIYGGSELQYTQVVGDFIWHTTHDHFHFEDFSIYELWTLSPSGRLDKLVSTSGKLSYCVIDTDIIDREMEGFSPYKRYGGCGRTLQGLSIGWGDTYESHLDGQSIPLPGIVDGYYALKSSVNPDAILLEENYGNNTAVIYLNIRGMSINSIDVAEYFERRCQDAAAWTVRGLVCSF